MAADLASRPHSGLLVQLCGDAHVLNFGLWATPERNLLFDLRDFDETLPRPFEWDVQRLAASLVVAAREDGLKAATADEAVVTAVEAYRDRMARYAKMSELGLWYDGTHVDSLISCYTPADQGRISVHIEKESRSRTHLGAGARPLGGRRGDQFVLGQRLAVCHRPLQFRTPVRRTERARPRATRTRHRRRYGRECTRLVGDHLP